MKPLFLAKIFKPLLISISLAFCISATAQTLMDATAKDGTYLSFIALKDPGDDTELQVKKVQQKTATKYLVYMPTIDGHIRFAEPVLCQRNCANAKPATPGVPLKGGYLKVGTELRCIKNCNGIERGLVFDIKR